MASRWIVKRGEKQAGPFTSPQLRSLAKSGQLRRSDRVTRQGSNRFVPAVEVKGLAFPEFEVEVPDELEYGTVEIIDDEEPVIVVEAADEPAVVDYDYSVDEEEDEEPVPPRRARSAGSEVPAGSRRSSRSEPTRSRSHEDEGVGYVAWLYLFAGVVCIATGIGLVLVIDYALGGRLMVMGTFSVIALGFFYRSIKKFTKR